MPERRLDDDPIPTSRLGDLHDWVLDVRCASCRQRARKPVSLLAEKHGEGQDIWRVVLRLRCGLRRPGTRIGHCGGKPDYVALLRFNIRGKSATMDRQVVILGKIEPVG